MLGMYSLVLTRNLIASLIFYQLRLVFTALMRQNIKPCSLPTFYLTLLTTGTVKLPGTG